VRSSERAQRTFGLCALLNAHNGPSACALCPEPLLTVLRFVYPVAHPVLLAIDRRLLALRQLAAVDPAVRMHFLINAGFTFFEARRLARRQGAGLDPLRDAVLLIFPPLPDLTGLCEGPRQSN